MKIRIVGGGGGGAGSGGGSGAGNAGSGATGGTSTFGTSLISSTGGGGGVSSGQAGGSGGSGTVSSPASGFVFGGGAGINVAQYNTARQVFTGGSSGPPTPLGAFGAGGYNAGNGPTAVCMGGTGGAAGYVEAIISSPSAFVEPIEATSIGGTIQQVRCLVQNLQSYKPGCVSIQKNFNKKMNIMMENTLAMISLHYISDRTDSPMWLAQKEEMKIPEYLQELLDLWQERSPSYYDVETNNYEMFIMPHLYHVAQGQKLLSKDAAERMISMYSIKEETKQEVFQAKLFQSSHTKVDHAEALRQIQI